MSDTLKEILVSKNSSASLESDVTNSETDRLVDETVPKVNRSFLYKRLSSSQFVEPVNNLSDQSRSCVNDRLCTECAFKTIVSACEKDDVETIFKKIVSACEKDDVETLQQLLSIAASNGSYNCFKEIESKKKSNLNHHSSQGFAPLHEVCTAEETEKSKKILKLLLNSKEVDLNATTDEGKTGVMLAYEAGNKEMWRMLMEVKSVDLSIKDSNGQTLKDKIEQDLENHNGLTKSRKNQLKLLNDEIKSRRHYGYTSKYYTPNQQDVFLQDVEVGDSIEFHRGTYSHWAVWIGSRNSINGIVRNADQVDDLVCHRGVENTYNPSNLCKQSDILYKEERGIGEIYFASLAEIVKDSEFRINNNDDKESDKVFSGEEILERLSDVVDVKSKYDMGEYHFIGNNCEHFVKWARNDKKRSLQSIFFAYRISFVILGLLIIGMSAFAYCVWKGVESEERTDTTFCGCRAILDETKYENIQYPYGEIFISNNVAEKDHFLSATAEFLERQHFSSAFHSQEILIKSKKNRNLDFCGTIQFNSTIADRMIMNSSPCNTCHGSRDKLFREKEIYFWVISGIIVVCNTWIFRGILAGSHKTGLYIRKVAKIITYNVCSVLLWISMAFLVQTFITRR